MSLAYPLFLFALIAVAVPVLIHLFYFRRYKKVYFSNVKWLQEAVREQKKAGKLRERLILLSRILAVAALVLAFAQPFLGKKSSEANVSTGTMIYIDNSFSMGAEDKGRILLDNAKSAAQQLVKNGNAAQQYLILTNHPEAIPPRWMSKDECLSQISKIQLTPSFKKLSSISEMAQLLFRESAFEKKNWIVFSDFQKVSADEVKTDSTIATFLVPVSTSDQRNISIDSLWMADPVFLLQAVNKCVVKLVNHGDANRENIPLTLKINGQVKNMSNITIKAGETILDTLTFTLSQTGWQKGEVFIQDFPVQFDDSYFFAFAALSNREVLSIEEVMSPRSVTKVFETNRHFLVRQEQSNALSSLVSDKFSLIILNEIKQLPANAVEPLKQYVNQGGSLYIIPGAESNISSINVLLKSLGTGTYTSLEKSPEKVSSINQEEFIVQAAFEKIPSNVDLPTVKMYYPISSDAEATEYSILQMQNGRPFLEKYVCGMGAVYLQAAGLSSEMSDFSSKAIFPPLLFNMAAFKARPQPLALTAGENDFFEWKDDNLKSDVAFKMRNGSLEFIPSVKPLGNALLLGFPPDIQQSGVFDVYKGADLAGAVALNFNRKESELKFFDAAELKKQFENEHVSIETLAGISAESSSVSNGGTALWKLCVILGIIALIMEIILIRTKPKTTAA